MMTWWSSARPDSTTASTALRRPSCMTRFWARPLLTTKTIRTAVVDDKDHPLLVLAEQGTGRHLQDMVAAIDQDTRINAIVVPQRLPLGERRDQVDNDVDTLFLDPEG